MLAILQQPDTTDQALGGAILVIALCIISLAVYFLPAYMAKDKRSFGSVFVLNFFLGWTLIGWVVALAWALKDDSPTKIIVNSPSPAMLCATCGKYSASGSRFCASCGANL